MTHWHTINRVLEQAELELSATQIQIRAKKHHGDDISLPRVTKILNKMESRGRVEKDTEQVGRKRITFFQFPPD